MTLTRLFSIALVLPAALAGLLALEVVRNAVLASGDAAHVAERAALLEPIGELTDRLREERAISADFVASGGAFFTSSLGDKRAATDQAIGRLADAAAPNGPLSEALGLMRQLPEHRARIDDLDLSWQAAADLYTTLTHALLDTIAAAVRDGGAPRADVANLLAWHAIMRGIDAQGLERSAGAAMFGQNRFDPGARARLRGLADDQARWLDQARLLGGGEAAAMLTRIDALPETARLDAARAAIAGQEARPGGVTGTDWYDLASHRLARLMGVEEQLLASLQARAAAGLQSAERRAQIAMGAAAVGLALLLAIMVGLLLMLRRATLRTRAALTALAQGKPLDARRQPSLRDFAGFIALASARKAAEAPPTPAPVQPAQPYQPVAASTEARHLSDFNDWLQSSDSLAELVEMVEKFMPRFIPEAEGAFYVYTHARDVLAGAAGWNGGAAQETLFPSDCWALRKGRTVRFQAGDLQLRCKHDQPEDPENDPLAYSICIPIIAHGETVGMLHLRVLKTTQGARGLEVVDRLAAGCVERISLALANMRLRDQLHERTVRDPLTGLYNARYMADCLSHFLDRGRREHQTTGIILIEVDHFQSFANTHGHEAGEVVLRSLATTLVEACTGDELACHLGGERLALLIPGLPPRDLTWRAEALRQAIEDQTIRYGETLLSSVTISAGVAAAPDHASTVAGLMKAADQALCRAKAQGRNQVESVQPESGELAIVAYEKKTA